MPLIVLVTTPPEQARSIASTLVEEQLAGCVSIIPTLQSIYRWQGEVQEGHESLLLIKTLSERYAQLEQRLKDLHPYEVPEIIALPADRALPAFSAWLHEAVTPHG